MDMTAVRPDPTPSGLGDAAEVVLLPRMPAAQAFARMVAGGLAQVAAALDAAAALDVEGIHDVRVGLRRTRAPIALFEPCLGPAARSFDRRLREPARVLGAAREWDVLLTESLPAAEADGMARARVGALADAVAAPRREAQASVLRTLAEDFPALLPAVAAWAEDGARAPVLLGDAARLGRRTEILVPRLMDRLARRVRKQARGHRHADTVALHKLRKRTKTLRYAAEALAPLYGRKAVKPLARHCKHLQDVLGRVNDAASIPVLLDRLAAPPDSELAQAVAEVAAWARERGAHARGDVTKAWHAVRDTDPFWN